MHPIHLVCAYICLLYIHPNVPASRRATKDAASNSARMLPPRGAAHGILYVCLPNNDPFVIRHARFCAYQHNDHHSNPMNGLEDQAAHQEERPHELPQPNQVEAPSTNTKLNHSPTPSHPPTHTLPFTDKVSHRHKANNVESQDPFLRPLHRPRSGPGSMCRRPGCRRGLPHARNWIGSQLCHHLPLPLEQRSLSPPSEDTWRLCMRI